jgi:hypothetical protein
MEHMRKFFIDNLRWMIIVLLIPYHAAQAFNTWGELNYITFSPNRPISSLIVFLSPYYMPLMFLLAGMSTNYALKKRTYRQFVLERIKRLLVPFVFGTIFLCPLLAYLGDKNNYGYTGSFLAHYRIFFTKWTDLAGFDGGFNVGQYWFLYYLLVISLAGIGIVALVSLVTKKKTFEGNIPFPVLCLFVIPLPFLYDILSVGGKSFAEYLYVFLIGYFVLAGDEMIEKCAKYRYLTLTIGLIACCANVYMFIWSGEKFGIANTIAKAFAEWFMILSLIGVGKKSLVLTGKVTAYLSKRSILFFSLHFIGIVLFQMWFAKLFEGNPLLLYAVPILPAYVATFLCSEIAARIPLLSFLMGSKAYTVKRKEK